MEEEEQQQGDYFDKDIMLPCGHIGYRGNRPGIWIEDERFGWCQTCGAMYNSKVLRALIADGTLELYNNQYIKKKGLVL